jgi:hypothetical protein
MRVRINQNMFEDQGYPFNRRNKVYINKNFEQSDYYQSKAIERALATVAVKREDIVRIGF